MTTLSTWQGLMNVPAGAYTCGYCGLAVGQALGYFSPDKLAFIYPCPRCDMPTVIQGDRQIPGVAFGSPVHHLPEDVAAVYTEARNCMAVNAFTGAALLCRKLLMNIAVQKGAAERLYFTEYVKYLEAHSHISVDSLSWVAHIREKGGEATHLVAPTSREDAEDLLLFTEMMLKTIYDYPARAARHAKP